MSFSGFQQDIAPIAPGTKVVIGFSGGLDTTFCVKYLTDEKGLEVHSVVVNTGGFSEQEVSQIEQHARNLGVILLRPNYPFFDLRKCVKK